MKTARLLTSGLGLLAGMLLLGVLAGCDNDGYYVGYDRPYYSRHGPTYYDDDPVEYRRSYHPKVVVIDTPRSRHRDVCGVCGHYDCGGHDRKHDRRYDRRRSSRYDLRDRRHPPRFPPPGEDWDDGEWEWDDGRWEWDD